MAVLTTGDLAIPDQILDPWIGKIQAGSTIASLSTAIPMKFGVGQTMTFDAGEAEIVEEGANKNDSDINVTTKTVTPHKFQKTVRWTDEVMYADEDHQLGVVRTILDGIAPALARALDFGVFHGIDPLSGTIAVSIGEALSDTPNTVTFGTGKPYKYLDDADALVLGKGYVPRDVALDPAWAAGFSTARGNNSEVKLYPNFRLGTDVSELDGHRASVSRTVGAVGVADTPTGIVGFVGDFDAIQWGIQRSIGLEVIRYGNPDGQGDLKRNNQVAFRAEVIYGWGIASLDAFAVVGDSSGGDS